VSRRAAPDPGGVRDEARRDLEQTHRDSPQRPAEGEIGSRTQSGRFSWSLLGLSKDQADALMLAVSGLTYRQIALRLGISTTKSKALLREGLLSLQPHATKGSKAPVEER
jgi:DNA-directed RNA polymerase specialized sigma24 family protein